MKCISQISRVPLNSTESPHPTPRSPRISPRQPLCLLTAKILGPGMDQGACNCPRVCQRGLAARICSQASSRPCQLHSDTFCEPLLSLIRGAEFGETKQTGHFPDCLGQFDAYRFLSRYMVIPGHRNRNAELDLASSSCYT